MDAAQVSAMAKTLAHYLTLLGSIPGVPGQTGLLAGAAALESLAANSAECELIAHGATTAVAVFQAIVNWLRGNGHSDAATALMAVH